MVRAVIRWILGVNAEPLLDVAARFAWAVPVVAALSLLSSALESLSITLLVPLLGSLSGQSTTPRFLSPLSFIFEWGASKGALARILVPAGLMLLLIIVKSGVQSSNAVLTAWVDSTFGGELRKALARPIAKSGLRVHFEPGSVAAGEYRSQRRLARHRSRAAVVLDCLGLGGGSHLQRCPSQHQRQIVRLRGRRRRSDPWHSSDVRKPHAPAGAVRVPSQRVVGRAYVARRLVHAAYQHVRAGTVRAPPLRPSFRRRQQGDVLGAKDVGAGRPDHGGPPGGPVRHRVAHSVFYKHGFADDRGVPDLIVSDAAPVGRHWPVSADLGFAEGLDHRGGMAPGARGQARPADGAR